MHATLRGISPAPHSRVRTSIWPASLQPQPPSPVRAPRSLACPRKRLNPISGLRFHNHLVEPKMSLFFSLPAAGHRTAKAAAVTLHCHTAQAVSAALDCEFQMQEARHG